MVSLKVKVGVTYIVFLSNGLARDSTDKTLSCNKLRFEENWKTVDSWFTITRQILVLYRQHTRDLYKTVIQEEKQIRR